MYPAIFTSAARRQAGESGACEAGARTAQRPHRRQETQQQKRETAGNGYAYLHLTVEYDDVLAFLPPNLL